MPSPYDDPNAPELQAKADPAAPFVKMADQIKHNTDAPFGGAFVVVPPGNEEPLSALILTKDPAQFWMMVSAKVQFRLQELERNELKSSSFGRR